MKKTFLVDGKPLKFSGNSKDFLAYLKELEEKSKK